MKTLIKSLLVAISFTIITGSAVLAETNPGKRTAAVSSFKSGIYTTAEGKLNIALDKEVGGSVMIRLTDRNGKVFLTEQVGKRQTVARLRLDISALPDGTYQVEITNGVDTTTHALTLTTQQPSVSSRFVAVN